MSRREHLKADALLLGITALWGATFVVVKDALELADGFSFLALRFGVGALALVPFIRRAHLTAGLWKSASWLGLLLFVGFAFQTFGLALTSPSRSAFITGLSVVLVPFGGLLVFKRRPDRFALMGVVLSLVGLALLTGGFSVEGGGLGELLTLGCAIVFSLHIVFTGELSRRHPALPLVGVQLAVTSALSAACLPFVQTRVEWTAGLWGAVLVCGVLASALAIGVQTWAQARTTAVHAALIFALEPVFASALSVFLGREVLGARELLGGALIVFAVVAAEGGTSLLRKNG